MATLPAEDDSTAAAIVPAQPTKTSWSAVVQNHPTLRKHDLSFTELDGSPVVDIPDDVIEDSPPLWEDFIIGKFLSKAPHVGKIHVIVNKIWPLGEKAGKIDTFVVNDFTIKFRIRDRSTRLRVLHRHMWNIAGIPMYASKWSPIVEEAQPSMTSVPLWVILKNVPHQMFSWDGLGFLASAVGHPTKLHPDTESCKSFEEARVSVIADLSKELPKSFRFKSRKDIDAVVEFSYPWLPARCVSCKNWGHKSEDCISGKKMKEKNRGGVATPTPTEVMVSEQPPAPEVSIPAQQTQKVSTEECVEVRGLTETEVVDVEQGEIISTPQPVIAEEENIAPEEGGWKTVSPTKKGKLSPVSNDKILSILSSTKFSILTEEEDKTEEEDEGSEGDEEKEEKGESASMISKGDLENDKVHELGDVPVQDASIFQSKKARRKASREQAASRSSLPRASKSAHKVIHGSDAQEGGKRSSQSKQ